MNPSGTAVKRKIFALILVIRNITSDSCDCKQVTKKSPPVRHVVRHNKVCLEIKFRWNRTKLKFSQFRRPVSVKPEVGRTISFSESCSEDLIYPDNPVSSRSDEKSIFVTFFDGGHFENGGHLDNSEKSLRPSERRTFLSPSFMFVGWAVFSVGCGQVHGRGKKTKKIITSNTVIGCNHKSRPNERHIDSRPEINHSTKFQERRIFFDFLWFFFRFKSAAILKWRPSWKFRKWMSQLHMVADFCAKFGQDPWNGLSVSLRTFLRPEEEEEEK